MLQMCQTPYRWNGKASPRGRSCSRIRTSVSRAALSRPGAVHVCHSHPSYLYYTISGGQAQVQDEKGVRKIEVATGAFVNVPPTPWQEFTNVGDSTMQFVVVEK